MDRKNDTEAMDVEQIEESHDSLSHDLCEEAKLSSFKLTTIVWSFVMDPGDDFESTFKNEMDNYFKEFNTKTCDFNKIEIISYFKRFLEISSMWVDHHKESVFKDWDIKLVRSTCLPKLIWRPDCSIDNLKTAEALIESANLTDELKYKLMCSYCMEDQIINIWPRLVENQSVVLDVFFDDEVSLLSYWNSRMAGYFSKSGMKFVENRILSKAAIENLSAAVYFFDRFTIEERVGKGCELILCVKLDKRAECVKTIISKFNDNELHRAFRSHCSDIMYPLIMNPMYAEFAFEIWNRAKSMLTIQSFLSIMTRIAATLRMILKNPNRHFPDEFDSLDDFRKHIFTTVGNLWQNTPTWLKKHDLTSSRKGVVSTMAECYVTMNDWDPEQRFLFIILSDAGVKVVERFLSKFSAKLMKKCQWNVFKDLIQIYKNIGCDINGSRISFVDVKHAKRLFGAKKFVELQEYLEIEPNRASIDYVRYAILKRKKHPIDVFESPLDLDGDEIEQLRKFIICVAENYPTVAATFKRNLSSYYPWLSLEPVETDNELFACYSGLERS